VTGPYFLGIDGGGTKCKARLEDRQGNFLAEFVSGPANPFRDFNTAIESIEQAVAGVYFAANLAPQQATASTHAVIGLAGLNIPSCLDTMQRWKHPFANLQLTTDLHIACVGAHKQDAGAIVIIGTGSSGVVCTAHRQIEFGGHGFSLGDKGSGAWFGSHAIRCALESLDGIRPCSPLIDELMQYIQCEFAHQIVDLYLDASPAKFAELAPIVFKHADNKETLATEIVTQGADYINQLCHQMMQHNPPRFALIGGLSHKIVDWLKADITAQLCAPLNTPEAGAILIARNQYSVRNKLA